MGDLILAIDQGTTGTRAVVYDVQLRPLCISYREHRQYCPRPGWCEHDCQEIFDNLLAVTDDVLDRVEALGYAAEDVVCAGMANQGETCTAWRKSDGTPLCRALVWHCRRADPITARLREDEAFCRQVRQTTGLPVSTYYSAVKYRWMLEQVPAVREAQAQGDLCLGTLDSWLIYRLTQGRLFVTDCVTASRTMLCDLRTLQWDGALVRRLGLEESLLAEIRPNDGFFGFLSTPRRPRLRIPLTGCIVDQQGALLGEGCFRSGQAKLTYGTGCFLLANTGASPLTGGGSASPTPAWRLGDETAYAADLAVFTAGSSLQWLRDRLQIIDDFSQIDAMAQSLPGNEGVYFVPAFSGLAGPHPDETARGTLLGLTLESGRAHVVRAAMEAIAFQAADLVDALEAETGRRFSPLRADGGISRSAFLLQMQSDLLDRPLLVSSDREATARGTAMLAGLGAGLFKDLEELEDLCPVSRTYTPAMDAAARQTLRAQWSRAVERAGHWA